MEVKSSFKIYLHVFLQIISILPADTHRERGWSCS